MEYDVRPLTADDRAAAERMSRIAFGGDPQAPPQPLPDRAGSERYGVFDPRGRLLAKAADRKQAHWFGGRLVPASGVAGVAVAPEVRGRGLAQLVMTRLLREAHERGAAVSTLFRTAPALYRRLGWEQVGALAWTTLPTAALAGLRMPPQVTVRAAEPADVPAILEIYRRVARDGNGLLERSGPLFETSPEGLLAAFDGVSVVDGPDGIEGYASWQRGRGYDVGARLTVYDLIGQTGPATTALLALLGSWSSVTPTLALRLPDPDPVPLLAPVAGARVETSQPWMLRIVDAPAAIAARGWPPYLRGTVDLDLADPVARWHGGRYRLTLDAGEARLEPGGDGSIRLSGNGLAVLYAGGGSPALLRRAGLLDGDPGCDGFLRAAFAGPPPALLDYF